MSSYTKWDRAAYVDRVGGEEEAERRRVARRVLRRSADPKTPGIIRGCAPGHRRAGDAVTSPHGASRDGSGGEPSLLS